MGFADASVLVKVCVVVLPLALLLQIIGIATNYWVSVSLLGYTSNSGLWKVCVDSTCADISSLGLTGWMKATRAFGIIGILAIAPSVVLTFLCIFVFTKAEHKIPHIMNMILAFVGGGSILLSIIIYGAKYADGFDLGWSFGLSVAGGILSLIGGALLAADNFKSSS